MNFKKYNKGIYCILQIAMLVMVFMQIFKYSVACAANQKGSTNNNNVVDYIDAKISELVNNKLAKGITVSIVQNNEVVLSKGYGYADEHNGIKVDPEVTCYKIGSVSKIFVAIAAMQLQEQGKLDMKAPISRYLEEDFPDFKYPVTMDNLLTHTAGFEDIYSPLEVEFERDIIPLKDFVRGYMPEQVFKPGEVSAYSNYGISLAGYVMERITGMSFYDYTEKYIFEPLGMMNTTYRPASKGEISKAYSPKGEEKADVLEHSYPAGSVTSTAEDMAKCMQFLLEEGDQSILSSNGKMDMFQRHFSMDNEFPGYGYVWMRHEINGHTFYEHGGGTANFTSELALFPEQKLGIFISSNQINDYELAEYTFGIAEMLYGKELGKTAYTGENTKDISGYYLPARSVFKGSDKFVSSLLNLLCGFPKHITGNSKNGYKMDGTKLIPVGKDTYSLEGKPEEIKFIQKGKQLYYSPKQYYTSCIRVPWYEGSPWQVIVIASFIILSLLGFMIAAIRAIVGIVKKKGKYAILVNVPYIAVFLIFLSMIIRFVVYINYMNDVFGDINCTAGLEGVIAYFKVAAPMLVVSGLCGIASTVLLWLKKRNAFICIFYSMWSVSIVLFITWLIQMNLIG